MLVMGFMISCEKETLTSDNEIQTELVSEIDSEIAGESDDSRLPTNGACTATGCTTGLGPFVNVDYFPAGGNCRVKLTFADGALSGEYCVTDSAGNVVACGNYTGYQVVKFQFPSTGGFTVTLLPSPPTLTGCSSETFTPC